jgi:peptidoglycan/LPS O-acetylase OafA/YrhL
LDLLRGIAALLVALYHFSYGTIGNLGHKTGGVCVVLFFVLSGFVIRHAYGSEIARGGIGFRRFLTFRLARLYPLHFATFAVVFLYWVAMDVGKAHGLPISVSYEWDARTILENITLTHFWFQGTGSFNSPSWSISVELWCSLYVYFLCKRQLRLLKALAITGVVLSFAAIQIDDVGFFNADRHLAFGFLEKNYVTGALCFTLGWLIHRRLSDHNGAIKSEAPLWLGWPLAVAFFCFVTLSRAPVPKGGFPELAYIGACGALVYLLAVTRTSRVGDLLGKICGDLSYGIYLCHVPLMLFLVTAARILEVRFGYHIVGTHIMDALFLTTLPLVARMGFLLIEQPGKRFIRSLGAPKALANSEATPHPSNSPAA